MRPRLAVLALAGLLLGQTLVPCGMLLSSVRAAELRVAGPSRAAKRGATMPTWVKQGGGQSPRDANLRLAQVTAQDKGGRKSKVVNEAECLDCEVSLEPLDLSDVPTEAALRRAGGRDGALYPMRRGDAEELGTKLDRLLKRAGVKDGLREQLPPKDPRFAALKRAKERYERARAINTLFGRAVKEWQGGDRAQAARLFGEYMDKFPRTPWAGESALHLGYAAKNDGRLLDARGIFAEILDKTSDEPNEKLREAKRQRKARGGGATDEERDIDVTKALEGAATLEAAVEKLDSSKESDDDDESFEIHMKAKQQLADIALAMGHYGDAGEMLGEIMEQDTDWHRRVWARAQLQRANFLSSNGASLMACGPQALGAVLVGMDKDAAAEKVKATVVTGSQGLSMAELRTLAAKNGVAMRGFRADAEQLPKLALPAILHYDYGRDGKASAKNSGHFVVLQGVDARGESVRLFDPLTKSSSRMSFAALERQWSGQGLAVASASLVGASLDERAMKAAVGSSTVASSDLDMGDNDANVSVGVGDGVDGPAVSVHQASLNVYAQHTVLAYQPARGPAVNITLSYNSDSESNYAIKPAMGEKWMFNYATQGEAFTTTPYTSGRVVEAFEIQMPDGTKSIYHEQDSVSNGVLKGVNGDFNYVQMLPGGQYELVFPNGTKWLYTTQSGRNNFYLDKERVKNKL